MVIPRVKLSEKYIKSELEEMEREDNFRLKRFKELKEKKAGGGDKNVCAVCKLEMVQIEICEICETCEEKREKISICPLCEEDIPEEPVKEKTSSILLVDTVRPEDVCSCTDEVVGDVLKLLCPNCQKQLELQKRTDAKNVCSCEEIQKSVSEIELEKELCSCEKLDFSKSKPNINIGEGMRNDKNTCACQNLTEPKEMNMVDLCKIIGQEKVKKLKDIYLRKDQSEDELIKKLCNVFENENAGLEKTEQESLGKNDNCNNCSNSGHENKSEDLCPICKKDLKSDTLTEIPCPCTHSFTCLNDMKKDTPSHNLCEKCVKDKTEPKLHSASDPGLGNKNNTQTCGLCKKQGLKNVSNNNPDASGDLCTACRNKKTELPTNSSNTSKQSDTLCSKCKKEKGGAKNMTIHFSLATPIQGNTFNTSTDINMQKKDDLIKVSTHIDEIINLTSKYRTSDSVEKFIGACKDAKCKINDLPLDDAKSTQSLNEKCSCKSLQVKSDDHTSGKTKDLGNFVTKFQEVVTIKRRLMDDGTVKEEKQVITVKTEANSSGNANDKFCQSSPPSSFKEKQSCQTNDTVQQKYNHTSDNQPEYNSINSYTSCDRCDDGEVRSKPSINPINSCSNAAQTDDRGDNDICSKCRSKPEIKRRSTEESFSDLAARDTRKSNGCSSHCQDNIGASKSYCAIKIVPKPQNNTANNNELANNCLELLKKILLEADQSTASCLLKKTVSPTCSCGAKMSHNAITPNTRDLSYSTSKEILEMSEPCCKIPPIIQHEPPANKSNCSCRPEPNIKSHTSCPSCSSLTLRPKSKSYHITHQIKFCDSPDVVSEHPAKLECSCNNTKRISDEPLKSVCCDEEKSTDCAGFCSNIDTKRTKSCSVCESTLKQKPCAPNNNKHNICCKKFVEMKHDCCPESNEPSCACYKKEKAIPIQKSSCSSCSLDVTKSPRPPCCFVENYDKTNKNRRENHINNYRCYSNCTETEEFNSICKNCNMRAHAKCFVCNTEKMRKPIDRIHCSSCGFNITEENSKYFSANETSNNCCGSITTKSQYVQTENTISYTEHHQHSPSSCSSGKQNYHKSSSSSNDNETKLNKSKGCSSCATDIKHEPSDCNCVETNEESTNRDDNKEVCCATSDKRSSMERSEQCPCGTPEQFDKPSCNCKNNKICITHRKCSPCGSLMSTKSNLCTCSEKGKVCCDSPKDNNGKQITCSICNKEKTKGLSSSNSSSSAAESDRSCSCKNDTPAPKCGMVNEKPETECSPDVKPLACPVCGKLELNNSSCICNSQKKSDSKCCPPTTDLVSPSCCVNLAANAYQKSSTCPSHIPQPEESSCTCSDVNKMESQKNLSKCKSCGSTMVRQPSACNCSEKSQQTRGSCDGVKHMCFMVTKTTTFSAFKSRNKSCPLGINNCPRCGVKSSASLYSNISRGVPDETCPPCGTCTKTESEPQYQSKPTSNCPSCSAKLQSTVSSSSNLSRVRFDSANKVSGNSLANKNKKCSSCGTPIATQSSLCACNKKQSSAAPKQAPKLQPQKSDTCCKQIDSNKQSGSISKPPQTKISSCPVCSAKSTSDVAVQRNICSSCGSQITPKPSMCSACTEKAKKQPQKQSSNASRSPQNVRSASSLKSKQDTCPVCIASSALKAKCICNNQQLEVPNTDYTCKKEEEAASNKCNCKKDPEPTPAPDTKCACKKEAVKPVPIDQNKCSCKKEPPAPEPKKCSCQKEPPVPVKKCSCKKESAIVEKDCICKIKPEEKEEKKRTCKNEPKPVKVCSCQAKGANQTGRNLQPRSAFKGGNFDTKSCPICAEKEKAKLQCSCDNRSQTSLSSGMSDSRSVSTTTAAALCPKCAVKAPSGTQTPVSQAKSTCSCQSCRELREIYEKRSKSSFRSGVSKDSCPVCEMKLKDATTTTRRTERFDVRGLDMIKVETPKKKVCTCSSDSYVTVDDWKAKLQARASSYHGRCYY